MPTGTRELIPIDQEVEGNFTSHLYFSKIPLLRKYELKFYRPPQTIIRENARFQKFSYVTPTRPLPRIYRSRNPSSLAVAVHPSKAELESVYGLKKDLTVSQQELRLH